MNFIPQHDQMDCGPACLAMIASHYGVDFGLQYLRDKSFITKEGVSLLGICEAAEKIGMKTVAVKSQLKYVDNSLLPCILHWNQNHFVVLHKISKNVFTRKPVFKIADPGHGYINLSEEKLKKSWISGEEKGVVLFWSPQKNSINNPPVRKKNISKIPAEPSETL